MSFFKKYTPVGSTPIAPQKRIIKTCSSTSSSAPQPSSRLTPTAAPKKTHRRVASSSVPPRTNSCSATSSSALESRQNGTTSAMKRKIDPARSTPNLKRSGTVEKRDRLKLPTPESVAGTSSRSPRSQRLESSDEESEDERETKRSKVGSRSPLAHDASRKLVHPISFRTKDPKSGEPVPQCEFIHAEQIANVPPEVSECTWSASAGGRRCSATRSMVVRISDIGSSSSGSVCCTN